MSVMEIDLELDPRKDGNSAFAAGRYHEAIAAYTHGIKVGPPDAGLYGDRAQTWIELERWNNAQNDATSALSLSPDSTENYWRRARARYKLKRLDGAKQDLEHMLRLDSNRIEAANLLSQVNMAILDRTPITQVPSDVLAKLKENPPVIDHQCFPHILDLIIAYAPRKSLLVLRAASRSFCQRIDGMWGRHLVLTFHRVDEPVATLKEHKHHSLLGIEYTFRLHSMNYAMDVSTEFPLAVDHETGLDTLLTNMRVLDICSEEFDCCINRCCDSDRLQTIRLRGHPHWYFTNDIYIDRASKVVIFPSLINHVPPVETSLANHLTACKAVRKVVYNVKLQRDPDGVLNVAPHKFELVGSSHADVVIIFSDNRAETFNQTWTSSAFQSAVRSLVAVVVSSGLICDSTSVTLVNYEAFAVPIMLDPITNEACTFDRHEQIVWELMRTEVKQVLEEEWSIDAEPPRPSDVGSVEEALRKLRFATIEEYRATLQPGEWELETVDE